MSTITRFIFAELWNATIKVYYVYTHTFLICAVYSWFLRQFLMRYLCNTFTRYVSKIINRRGSSTREPHHNSPVFTFSVLAMETAMMRILRPLPGTFAGRKFVFSVRKHTKLEIAFGDLMISFKLRARTIENKKGGLQRLSSVR